MSSSYLSKDHQALDEKSTKKQTSAMLWSDLLKDYCGRDEKNAKKQLSAAMLSCLFNDHRRLKDDRDWSMMRDDILEQISDRLSLLDLVRFRRVCKQWRSSPSSRIELANFSKDRPWLILYDPEKNKRGTPKCYIYSQFHKECCTFKLHDLEGAIIVESKFDWLLAHRGQFFFFYNPFTFSRINLPKLNMSGDYYSCTFTYLPTQQECTIFIVNRMNDSSLKFSMFRVSDKEWSAQTMSDISSTHFSRSIRVATCNHTNKDLCNALCPYSMMYNKIYVFDMEKKNTMLYIFLEKGKVVVYDYLKVEMPIEYELKHELISELKEMRAKHEKEWWKRSRGRYISVTFGGGKITGTLLIWPPHAVDERIKYEGVKASILEPKFSKLWFKLSFD